LNIAGKMVTIDQSNPTASCSYTLSPSSTGVGVAGGTGNLLVQAPEGCRWTAVSQELWISLTSSQTGMGTAAVFYSVMANPSANPRTGTIQVEDQSFTITQAGSCNLALSAAPTQTFTSLGGSLKVNLTGGCNWTAASSAA